MANTRSGGGAAGSGAPRDGHTPPPASAAATGELSNARETRGATAATANAQTPNLRRSTRETKGKSKYKQVPATTSSQRSATRPTRDATAIATPISASSPNKPKDSTKKSTRVRNTSVSPSPPPKQDSNGTSTSVPTPASAKRKTEDDAQTVTTSSKKQKKHMNAKSYIAFFSTPGKSPKSPVLATPLREDEENASQVQAEEDGAVLMEENASKVQAEDDGAVLMDEESNAQEQVNWEPSNVAANKVLEAHSTDLHGIPEVILEGDEFETESHQPDLVSKSCMPVEMCSLNKAAESISTLEIGEQAASGSNQNSLPELQNRDFSTAHHEVASKAIEDGNSIGTCTSRHFEAVQCDETDYNDNICVGCKSREISDILKFCDGKGCKQCYHLSCMDPPLGVSLGIWLCIVCTKKRLQFGIYSVSEGIESLWDAKEGADNRKQYFAKYKNVAHVHNRWVSESDIVNGTLQGHDLISKFSKRIHKEKTIRWKQEWAEPHRLLKRRPLMPPKEAEAFFNSLGDKIAYCNAEWLVKWKGLGYEHATWELESSSFLCTPEAEELKRSYENRLEAARRVSDPAKADKVKGDIFQKLQRLPDGCPPGLDDDHLSSLNQLLEFWHNSSGAVFIDDQERVIKAILFVTSILPYICRPLLIVSTSASLSLWEAKFSRLAASINVVVYNGDKDVRKSIRDLEFYEDGSVMLQVLLSHPDAILEDIEAIGRISWEAVMVDDCQNSRISKCLEQLKCLPTNFRMVLLSSSLKENIPEYINLLSFLNPEENATFSVSNGVSFDTAGTLGVLKAKLARYVAFERKADSSKLLEYWVPAHLSPVQLEMYCYTLLSNSPALRSHSKTDSVGALRNILVSLRKCCDHPYLVDQMLQSSLTKGHPVTDILDIGVRSCGKLLLLDKMLQKIRIEGHRVLILSQSGGGSGNPMGDILDDFVRQRFGFESYERVERGLLLQKKQAAMNMFNDKSKGRFIFLIDTRACGPSIKLSSVDAIIIYGSDWNPVNDLRAIQRISMESPSERVPIFRLYSSCTVEEKALILSKHDHILDSNILNISPSLSHCLLSWGASFLFNRLEEFQNPSYSCKGSDAAGLFVDNVALEFSTKLPNKVELSTEIDNTVISQAYLRGSFYSRNIVVVGEREGITSVDGDLPKFWAYWSSLLHGRSPCWQHISEPSQRSRRKIQNVEDQSKNTEKLEVPSEETDEARIKRKRIGEVMDSSPKVPPCKNKDTILSGNNTPSSSHQISVEDTWQELERNNLHGTQKGLHVQLKPELSKLHKLMQLPENVKSLCEEFLEYILKNHQISQEPKGILHAFNIALCWRAASLLKHKISRTESLTLAVKNLNYECTEELAEYVYAKLRILKKKFARRAGETSKQNNVTSVSNIPTCEQATSVELRNDELIPSTLIDSNFETGSNREATGDFWTEDMVSGDKELLSDPGTHREECLSRDELLSRIMDNRIQLVDKVFYLRGKNIQDIHSNEVSFLDRHRQKEVAKLREACNLVVEHLRGSQNHMVQEDRDGKIKQVIKWFTMLLYAFLEHMKCQRNRLDTQQSATWTKESHLKEEALQAAKSGQLDHTFDQHIPLPDSGFAMEEFSPFREVVGSCHIHAAAPTPPSLDDNSAMEITFVRSVNTSEVNEEEARNRPAEILIQGPASEVVGLSVNGICDVFDGINSQRDASLAVQSLEPPGGDNRSTHVEESTVCVPLQDGTSEHLGDAAVEGYTENRNTTSTDSPPFDTPTLTATPRQVTLPVSGEVEIQNNPVTQCAQQSLVSSQLSQGESEQADLSGVPSAQPLQSERQQSIPVSNNLHERAQPDPVSANDQTDAAPGSVQSAELFPVTSMMFNHPPIDAEPLKNELHRLRLYMDTVHKTHELKKTQLRMECSQEIEKVKRKYDLLIEEQDSTHLQQKKTLDNYYDKVLRNQSLAEDFRAKFISPSAAQARAHTPPIRQTAQASQQVPMRPSVGAPSASSISLSSACRPSAPRLRVQAPQVEQSSSLSQLSRSSLPSSQVVQPPPLIPGNLFRTTSATLSHMPLPRGSYGGQSELAPRAPAPHLQFKSPRTNSMPPGNQQQLPTTRVEATSPRTQPEELAPRAPAPHLQFKSPRTNSMPPGDQQQLPTTRVEATSPRTQPEELAPRAPAPHLQFKSPRTNSMPPGNQQQLPTTRVEATSPRANSSAPDSHLGPVATSGMSSLHSALPASSLPSSSQSNHLAQRVLPAPNPALQVAAPPGPSTATPSTTTGMQGSLSLDAWLTARLGLSGDAPRATAPVSNGSDIDVVCLSDDESE